ncbi:GntR family transcriptional regulator [Intrasporangium calvum]|uniref:GntR family transcriptional regulator n=1 Tax=Intrasporangium calvum TaxID=53358 RepID=A0ABT5GEH9_9MICO|nr:GntR family transcriptional regulator [Intrasporangium calvum]MDC5696220.1 GntR family transcriptional regulator [Intrasporangium calvum]
MLFQVDPASSAPLHEQVAASVRREMAVGGLTQGDRLPSAKEVASLLDINLHTVLRAYQALRDEGLIDLRRGRGAVVIATDPGGQARLSTLVTELVREAHRVGATRADLTRLIEKAY